MLLVAGGVLAACSSSSEPAATGSIATVTTAVPATTVTPATTAPVPPSTTVTPTTTTTVVSETTAASTAAPVTSSATSVPTAGGEPDWRAIIEDYYLRVHEIKANNPDPALVTEFCAPNSPCAEIQGSILTNLRANGEHIVNDIPPKIVSAERVPGMDWNPETSLSTLIQAVIIIPEKPGAAIIGPDGEVTAELVPGPSVRVGEEQPLAFWIARQSAGEPWQVFEILSDL